MPVMRSSASVPANMATTSPRMKSSGSLLRGNLRITPSCTSSGEKRITRPLWMTSPLARASGESERGEPVSGSRIQGSQINCWRKRAAWRASAESKFARQTGETAERSSPSGVTQCNASIGTSKGVPRNWERRVCVTGEPPALCIHGNQFHGASQTPKARRPRVCVPNVCGSVRRRHHSKKASHVCGVTSGSRPASRTKSLR